MAAVSDDPLRKAYVYTDGSCESGALRRGWPQSLIMMNCILTGLRKVEGGSSLARPLGGLYIAQSVISPSVSAIAFRNHTGYNQGTLSFGEAWSHRGAAGSTDGGGCYAHPRYLRAERDA